ncbi:MAG: hypothetical protein IJE89_02905 [Bacilli bacterium]|nr:hypothetical protein [Bacilli bacterium]
MVDKIKKNKYQILELTIIFILTLLFNLLCNGISNDDIWNYGFSYNILNGLVPYKDFNMVITPLYAFIGALFMKIFGESLVIYYLLGSLVSTTIFYHIKKITPNNYYIVYMIFLFFSMPGYNLFSLLLLCILMNLEKKKNNDYLIGLFLGLSFLSKQNIGLYLLIPTLFRKDIKIIVKRIIGFSIPNIIFLIYLIYNNILYNFIDYTFLGINSFATQNIKIIPFCLIIFIITMIILIYKYIKSRDIQIIYILCFQLIAFPIFDMYHVLLPFIIALAYFLKDIKLNKKIIMLGFVVSNITVFIYNINLYSTKNFSYPNNSSICKYNKISTAAVDYIKSISNYIKNNNNKKIFIVDMSAYLIKLEANIPINKYDLLNDGNLGKDGQYKIIKDFQDICDNEECTFLLRKEELTDKELSQYNQEIYKYIIENTKEKGEIHGLSIYKNY